MELQDLLDQIRAEYSNIQPEQVYFALRDYGVKRIYEQTVDVVRWCIAVDRVGIPITSSLLRSLCYNVGGQYMYQLLHRLGDFNVLTIIRDRHRSHRYLVNPLFLNRFQGSD